FPDERTAPASRPPGLYPTCPPQNSAGLFPRDLRRWTSRSWGETGLEEAAGHEGGELQGRLRRTIHGGTDACRSRWRAQSLRRLSLPRRIRYDKPKAAAFISELAADADPNGTHGPDF